MNKERRDLGCKNEVYQRKSMSLESCVEERGTRGKIMVLGEKRIIVSQQKENLAH
jgi:hypothetical protein